MKKVLVIGGTKYLGLEFIKLMEISNKQLFVASRKKIDVKHFIKIDRKNRKNLDNLFSDIQFDVVIDFINYSGLDSKILLESIRKQKKTPRLILISTIYTYAMPLKIECNSVYNEDSFNPLKHEYTYKDRPEVNYSEGKRDMEGVFSQNYDKNKLVILRFPIILGANDYTKRTHFYIEKINEGIRVNPKNINAKSCYVFAKEAANSIFNFVNNNYYGIYNVSFEALSESNLIKMFCKFYHFKKESLLSSDIEFENTPFTTNFDFIVDNNKYNNIFPINMEFEKALKRELSKI
jgi:nucleoside-diphosphate-sugar epimerase